MDCIYSCLYCGDQFLERYVRGRKTVQIVLGVLGGALLMVILLAIFGAFRHPACSGPPAELAVLAKAWPQNTCTLANKFSTISKHRQCKPADQLPAAFTLQGAWLRLEERETTLAHCNNRQGLFEPTSLTSDLRAKLEAQWPSLWVGHNESDYWGWEWNMGGSCTGPDISPVDYFGRAVALDEPYKQLLGWLTAKGISPSNDHPVKLADVRAAIMAGNKEDGLGEKQFALHCSKTASGSKDGAEHPLLEHIAFCLADNSLAWNGRRDCTEDLITLETESCGSADGFYLLADAGQPWGPAPPTTTTQTPEPTTPTTPTPKKEDEIPIPTEPSEA